MSHEILVHADWDGLGGPVPMGRPVGTCRTRIGVTTMRRSDG